MTNDVLIKPHKRICIRLRQSQLSIAIHFTDQKGSECAQESLATTDIKSVQK